MSTDYLKFLSGTVIRGDEKLLTSDFCERLGYAFALWLGDKLGKESAMLTVSVGRDLRPSGKRIADAFIKGLTDADADVFDCGPATTPAMQMSISMGDISCDGAVMVTASAKHGSINGFKLFTPEGSLTSKETEKLLKLAANTCLPRRLVKELDIMGEYRERLRNNVMEFMGNEVALPLLGLHVVVDCTCGTGRFFVEVLNSLGVDTDGSVNPNGLINDDAFSRNPESKDALKELSEAVTENGADLGVMFDADGDRVAIVDGNGKAINRNRLIALISAILLDDEKNLTFVTDSVTSSGLTRFITEWGGTHYRYRRGYRNVIDEAKRLSADGINVPVAIETSGHAAMAENYFIDDGMYLAMKVVCEAMWRKRDGLTLSSLIDELQEPVESIEVRLPIIQDDYRKAAGYVIEAVLSKTVTNRQWRLAPDNREGVRISFSLGEGIDNAWFMLRLSVHDPVMAVNAESDIPGGLKNILEQLYDVLAKDNEELDLTPLRAAIDQLKIN